MRYEPFTIYHVYNQGNNRRSIFRVREDYLCFLRYYKKLLHPSTITLAWCLMPNHFHFLIYTDERCTLLKKQGGIQIDPVANGFRKLLSGYARIYNNQYSCTGSLFRQKTKAKIILTTQRNLSSSVATPDAFRQCFNYVHQNPVTAGLCTEPENWEFSSYRDYTGNRQGILCDLEWGKKLMG